MPGGAREHFGDLRGQVFWLLFLGRRSPETLGVKYSEETAVSGEERGAGRRSLGCRALAGSVR